MPLTSVCWASCSGICSLTATEALPLPWVRLSRPDRRLASGEAELIVLPEGRSGELLVFRVFDRVSYALVRDVERAIQPSDRVVNHGT